MAPIFLVGFMGSGKSRIGRELAAHLGREFIDLDRLVEQRVGPLVPFFKKEGEDAFRELERDELLALKGVTDAVIATGGGTPFHMDNMDRMLEDGVVVYLDLPPAVLQDRLIRKGKDRPLLFGLDDAGIRSRVQALLTEREPGYRRARVVIDADADPAIVVQRIVEAIA